MLSKRTAYKASLEEVKAATQTELPLGEAAVQQRAITPAAHPSLCRMVGASPVPGVLRWSHSGSGWRSCRRKSADCAVFKRGNKKQSDT